jgi:hypothetical protein
MVDLIEEKFLKGEKSSRIRLKVNGENVPLSPFVQKSIIGTVRGMISALKGCESPQSVEIRISGDKNLDSSEET